MKKILFTVILALTGLCSFGQVANDAIDTLRVKQVSALSAIAGGNDTLNLANLPLQPLTVNDTAAHIYFGSKLDTASFKTPTFGPENFVNVSDGAGGSKVGGNDLGGGIVEGITITRDVEGAFINAPFSSLQIGANTSLIFMQSPIPFIPRTFGLGEALNAWGYSYIQGIGLGSTNSFQNTDTFRNIDAIGPVGVPNIDININPKGAGNINLGNFPFDADQTIGAGQDNFVLTYDNGTGLFSAEASNVTAGSAGAANNINVSDGVGGWTETNIFQGNPFLSQILNPSGSFFVEDVRFNSLEMAAGAAQNGLINLSPGLNLKALTDNVYIDATLGDSILLRINDIDKLVITDTKVEIDNSLSFSANTITNASGNITIDPAGTGNINLGNFTFDGDQTVGAGQDNFVLTYDNGTGLFSAEASNVTKVGTPVNNQIGVWTGDGTLEGDPRLTFPGTDLVVGDGTSNSTVIINQGSGTDGIRFQGAANTDTNDNLQLGYNGNNFRFTFQDFSGGPSSTDILSYDIAGGVLSGAWDFENNSLTGVGAISRTGGPIPFQVNGNEGIEIQTDGDVIFGTGITGDYSALINSETMANLDVRAMGAAGQVGGLTRVSVVAVHKHSGITNAVGYLEVSQQDGDRSYLWVSDAGDVFTSTTLSNVGTTTGTVVGTQTSDKRLKNIDKTFDLGLKEILDLEPISFSYKAEPNKKRLGFSAQQVAEILPMAVYDTGEKVDSTDKTKLAMYYSDVIPVLVKALQEQNEVIRGLQKRVSILERNR